MSKKGDDIWKNVEKIVSRVSLMQAIKSNVLTSQNSELFTLTYGSIVAQLCRDFNHNYHEVNNQLDQMGYNIGIRLIEDFLARTGAQRCQTFKETAEVITKVGFRIFLNIQPVLDNWSNDGKSCSIILPEPNPLSEFVEIPPTKDLWYSQILCGVLRGALQMIQLDVDVTFVKDTLKGDDRTEMRLKLNKILKDEVPAGED